MNGLCSMRALQVDSQPGPAVWAGLHLALLAVNERGYTVLHVHNESSASGQAPEEEGPGSC